MASLCGNCRFATTPGSGEWSDAEVCLASERRRAVARAGRASECGHILEASKLYADFIGAPRKRRRTGVGTIESESESMDNSVFCQARDLPPEKRHAAEVLLGGALGEDELVLVRSSKGRILKAGQTSDALEGAYRQLFDWSTRTAKKVGGIPDEEIDAAIDEAVDFVRHNRG